MSPWRFSLGLVTSMALASCSASPVAPPPQASETPSTPTAPTPPAPPTGPQPNFIITRGMNVVAEGGQSTISTVAFTRITDPNAYVLGLKQSDEVSSRTLLQPMSPAVATATGTSVAARSQGATSIRAAYHGRSYDLPFVVVRPNLQAAPAFAGTWQGTGVRYCTDVVGNTRSCYPDYITGQPPLRNTPVTLRLSHSWGVLTGTIEVGGSGGWTFRSGPVFAGIDGTGRLVVGGFFGDPSHGSHEQLLDWRFDLSGGQLSGTGITESGFINVYGPVLHRVTFTSITLTRQ